MPKIRFLANCTVNDGTGTTFEKGKVYDLKPIEFRRWVRQSKAEKCDDDTPAVEAKIVKPKAAKTKGT